MNKTKLKNIIFISIFLTIVTCLLPLKVEAADLELKSRISTEITGLLEDAYPSYDNQGNLDGYLFLVSNYYDLIKYDLNGKQIYYINEESTVDGINAEVIDSTDSSYQVKGKSDILLEVTDDNGNVILKKQYGGNGQEIDPFAFRSYNNSGINDGYYLVVITTSTDTKSGPGRVLIKYDLKGNIIFEKNVTEFYNDMYLDTILLYVNNNKLDSVINYDDTTIIRTDVTTEKTIFTIETDYDINRVNLSYNKEGIVDGIIVSGYDYENEYLIKYNLSGQEVFKKTIENYELYTIKSSRLPNGTYDGYIASATNIGEDIGTAILKFDLSGNLINENTFDETIYFIDCSINNYSSSGFQNGLIFLSRTDEGLLQLKFSYKTYEISKETTNEGTISVDPSAVPGEIVRISVTPKDGYSLKRIVVMDENGKEVEVNSDGTFIMPEGKVTVLALYNKIINPDTISAFYIVLATIILILFGTILITKIKDKNNV